MHQTARQLAAHMLLAKPKRLARWRTAMLWIKRIFAARGIKSEHLSIDRAPNGSVRIRDGSKILGQADVQEVRADWALCMKSNGMHIAGGHIEVGVRILSENTALGYFTGDLADMPVSALDPGTARCVAFQVTWEDSSTITENFPESGLSSYLPLCDIHAFEWVDLPVAAMQTIAQPATLSAPSTDQDGNLLYQGTRGIYYVPIAYFSDRSEWHQLVLPGVTLTISILPGGCLTIR